MLSIVTLTTACLYNSGNKFHYLKDFIEPPLKYIASQQLADGSFELNVATTALAIQALDIPRITGLNYSVEWQPDKALEWLKTAQLPDGSFGDIFTTTEVLMALSKRGYATFHYDKCPDLCCAYAGQLYFTTIILRIFIHSGIGFPFKPRKKYQILFMSLKYLMRF